MRNASGRVCNEELCVKFKCVKKKRRKVECVCVDMWVCSFKNHNNHSFKTHHDPTQLKAYFKQQIGEGVGEAHILFSLNNAHSDLERGVKEREREGEKEGGAWLSSVGLQKAYHLLGETIKI